VRPCLPVIATPVPKNKTLIYKQLQAHFNSRQQHADNYCGEYRQLSDPAADRQGQPLPQISTPWHLSTQKINLCSVVAGIGSWNVFCMPGQYGLLPMPWRHQVDY
jgi:hypothetical protein